MSIVVTAHAEGNLLHPALRSVARAAEDAAAAGIGTEILIIVDRPDPATAQYLDRSPFPWPRQIVNFGDPGLARNEGVAKASGRFVAFLDGDDLLARSWIRKAFLFADGELGDGRTVYHPEMVIAFGTEVVLARHESSTSPGFDPTELAELNLWRVQVLAPREFLLETPFVAAPDPTAFHEDWHWSCEVIAAFGNFVIVPGTCGFYRRRDSSLMMLRKRGLFMPTGLFQPGADSRCSEAGDSDGSAPRIPISSNRERRPRERAESLGRGLVLRAPIMLPVARAGRSLIRRLDARLVKRAIEPWLDDELRDIHQVERGLFPGRSVAGGTRYLARSRSAIGKVLDTALADTPAGSTHALLVPWLKRGGSDLESINYAKALVKLGERPVVIATEDTQSPWAHRLPPEVAFIELGCQLRPLDLAQRERLLAVYLLQAGVSRVHNVNSRLGFRVFHHYGNALKAYANLYVSTFCEDILPTGQVAGYAVSEVPSCEPWLTQIFADNTRVLAMLVDIFGIGADRTQVHYQPIELDPPTARPDRHLLHVLWAGRLDRQKRPDLLIQIAKRCHDLPIRFFVYGYGLLDPVVRPSDFSDPNVEFCGPYDDFRLLPLSEFDVFLNTSEWDGLPNILLEAIAAEMTIVSSDVGGIAEIVRQEQTGLLVSPFNDIDGYVAALGRLAEDRMARRRFALAAIALATQQHSWPTFCHSLRAASGYVGKR